MSKAASLIRTLLAIVGVLAAIIICYFYLDRPIAYWAHSHKLENYKVFVKIVGIPDALGILLGLGFFYYAITWQKQRLQDTVVLLTPMIITYYAAQSLKWVFGRTTPENWFAKGLENHFYPFTPYSIGFHDFPSGHSAIIVTLATTIWFLYPQWRWACLTVSGLVITGLVALQYHYLGSCLAGAGLGYLIAVYLYPSILLYWNKFEPRLARLHQKLTQMIGRRLNHDPY